MPGLGLFRRPPKAQSPAHKLHADPLIPPAVCQDFIDSIMADNPAFFWIYDPASGTITDQVSGLVLTNHGSPTYGASGPITGHTAITFPGSLATYFDTPDVAALQLYDTVNGGGPFWLESGFAKSTAIAADEFIFGKSDPTHNLGYGFQIEAGTEQVQLSRIGGARLVNTSGTVPTDGSFHAYGFSRNDFGAGNTLAYKDGIEGHADQSTAASVDNTLGGLTSGVSFESVGGKDPTDATIAYIVGGQGTLSQQRFLDHYQRWTVTCGTTQTDNETGAITPTGAFGPRVVSNHLVGAISSIVGTLPGRIVKIFRGGGFTPAGVAVKTVSRHLTGAISTITGALRDTPVKELTGTISTITGALPGKVVKIFRGGGFTPVGTIVRTVSQHLAGGFTPAGTAIKTVGQHLTGSISTITGALVKSRTLTLTGAIATLTGAFGPRTVSNHLTGAITSAGTAIKTVGRHLTGSISTITGSLARTSTKFLAGAISTITGALVRTPAKFLTGGVTPTGAFGPRTVSQHLAGSITPAGVAVKTTLKHLTGAIATITGTLARTPVKFVSGTITSAGSLVRSTSQHLTGGLASSGIAVKTVLDHLTGGLTDSGAVVKDPSIHLTGQVTPTGDVTPTVVNGTQIFTGEITPTGSVIKTVGQHLAGAIASSGTLAKTIVTHLAGAISTITATLARTPTKFLSGGIIPSGALGPRTVSQHLAGTVTLAGSVIKSISTHLAGSISSITGSLARTSVKVFTGAITSAGTVTRTATKTLSGSLASAGSIRETVSQHLSGSVTPAGSSVKTVTSHVSAEITPSGELDATQGNGTQFYSGSIASSGTLELVVSKTLAADLPSSGIVIDLISIHLTGAITPSGDLSAFRPAVQREFDGEITFGGSLGLSVRKGFAASLTPTGTMRYGIVTDNPAPPVVIGTGGERRFINIIRQPNQEPRGPETRELGTFGVVTSAGEVATLVIRGPRPGEMAMLLAELDEDLPYILESA